MDIIKTDPDNPDPQVIQTIVDHLRAGKVVLLPTETVYTLAVDATNEDAIRKVYEIKGRDFSKPLHVVVGNLEMAERYVDANDTARKLAKAFLPGPLTLVLPKKADLLPLMLTSSLPTLGIRIPDLPLSLKVSEVFGLPFTTTSANPSGGVNPYSVQDVLDSLSQKSIDMIDLAINVGDLPNVLPSTIVDISFDKLDVLRIGPISIDQLTNVVDR